MSGLVEVVKRWAAPAWRDHPPSWIYLLKCGHTKVVLVTEHPRSADGATSPALRMTCDACERLGKAHLAGGKPKKKIKTRGLDK